MRDDGSNYDKAVMDRETGFVCERQPSNQTFAWHNARPALCMADLRGTAVGKGANFNPLRRAYVMPPKQHAALFLGPCQVGYLAKTTLDAQFDPRFI